MVCIYCGGGTKVTNSRPQKRMNAIWRRRQCLRCGAIFTTTEAADLLRSWRIQKKSVLEPFSRDNLFVSIYDSLKHRKTALEDASGLTDTVINKCLEHVANATLDRDDLVTVAAQTLKHFDKAAASHYTAFHP
jgi:transcriptional repressor NrdR